MSNNSWRQYGGLSKIDNLNSINVGTVIADQIISRSSNPQYQLFNGTFEVTKNIIVDNDALIGNSSFIQKDLFITGNTYSNNKLFFGGNKPLSTDLSYVSFNILPSDSSYSFIFGNITNIGINTINPKATFQIDGYVQNILTVETSFNSITNVIGQNINKRGIVINANDLLSNIYFYNDVSTNIKYNSNGSVTINEPDAYIQYASGGILKLSTSQMIQTYSKNFLTTTSGGVFLLNGDKSLLESSGSILFNTSAGLIMTASGSLINLDPNSNRIVLGASGDFVLNVSGGTMNLNQNSGTLSSQGSIILNSSGGLVHVVSNNGKGNTIIDTSGAYLNANNTIISSFLNVRPSNYIGLDISGQLYNETMTLYDNSNSNFLYNIYNETRVKTGNALTIVAIDPCSNSFLRVVAPNKLGAAIGGGIFPNDSTRSMTMIGLNDSCGNYISSQTIVAGKNPIKNYSTMGINTFSPKVDNYVMDINGPTHISNGELHTFLNTNYEINTMSFSKLYPKNGIVTGSSYPIVNNVTTLVGTNYSTSYDISYSNFLNYTNDGGITWKQTQIDIINSTGLITSDIKFDTSFMYDSSYGIIGSKNSNFFYTSDGGSSWNYIQNNNYQTNTADTVYRNTGSIIMVKNNNNIRFFNAYKYDSDNYTKQIRYFDISIDNIDESLNGSVYQLNNFYEVSSSINIVASDSSGSYIYFVGSGITKKIYPTQLLIFIHIQRMMLVIIMSMHIMIIVLLLLVIM
jgi:hypothetical protein